MDDTLDRLRSNIDLNIKELCMEIIDCTNDELADEIEEKKYWLEQLYRCCDDPNRHFSFSFFADAIEIIEANLFRPLPPLQLEREWINIGPNFVGQNSVPDPLMVHLEWVYHLLDSLIDFIRHRERRIFIERAIDELFIRKLIQLTRSEDGDERNILVKIIQKLFVNLRPMRMQICETILQNLAEVIAEMQHTIYRNVDSLLNILQFIITNFPAANLAPLHPPIFRTLISLHRIPYIFNFYISLYSCSIEFLETAPSRIVQFCTEIFAIYRVHLRQAEGRQSNTRMLWLVEIQHIMDLLIRLRGNGDQSDERSNGAEIRRQCGDALQWLVTPLVNICADNLRSRNSAAASWTLRFLTGDRYRAYLGPHRKLIRDTILPILKDESYLIQWDEFTFMNQIVVRLLFEIEQEKEQQQQPENVANPDE